MKQYRDAELCYIESIDLYRDILHGTGSADLAGTLTDLGMNYNLMKEYSKANQSYSEALSVYRDILQGAGHAIAGIHIELAYTLYKQGTNYHTMKQYSDAEKCFMEALAIYEKESHTSGTINNKADTPSYLGSNYNLMKRYDEAEQSYCGALGLYRQMAQGADCIDVAVTLSNLGGNYMDKGDDNEGILKLKEALSIFQRLDPENPKIKELQDVIASQNSYCVILWIKQPHSM